jgi:hypothetical protein
VFFLRRYVPPVWIHTTDVKRLLYESMADRYTGIEQLGDVHKGSRNAESATWIGDKKKYKNMLTKKKN